MLKKNLQFFIYLFIGELMYLSFIKTDSVANSFVFLTKSEYSVISDKCGEVLGSACVTVVTIVAMALCYTP